MTRLIPRLVDYLKEKYPPGFSDLVWQAKMSGTQDSQILSWIYNQINNDSELKRKYRTFLVLVNLLFFTICVVAPPVLTAILPLGFIYLGNVLSRSKGITILFIALSFVSILPKIRDGAQIRIVKYIYRGIRIVGFSFTIIAVGALGFRYWWYSLSSLVIIGIGVYFFFYNTFAKNR